MWAKHKQPGFTIVELLIVIVVIGILAAITIVAYNGVQTRAENTKTLSGVAAYIKVFTMYGADKGEYPSTASWPCLGTPSSNLCAKVTTGTTSCNYSGMTGVSTTFNDLLLPYMGSTRPSISEQVMNCPGGDQYKGAYVEANSTNTKNLRVIYHLKGDLTCSVPSPATQVARSQAGDVTRCVVGMPTL